MIIFIEERPVVISSYTALFAKEGVSVTGFLSDDFSEWIADISETDLSAVEAVLLGNCENRVELSRKICKNGSFPVLAISDSLSLEQTLELFQVGMDDVLRKPMHVREILARVAAIRRRMRKDSVRESTAIEVGPIRVFNDGRDPKINGRELSLPRRERRILEYLVNNHNKRMSKSQIFNSVYGIFNDEVEENVVESHISKLRKKLKSQLGYDVIDSKRFMGYRLVFQN